MLLIFTRRSGAPVALDPSRVLAVTTENDQTFIVLATDVVYNVVESFAATVAAVEDAL